MRALPQRYGSLNAWPEQGPTREEALAMLSRNGSGPAYVLGIDQAEHSGWAVHNFTQLEKSHHGHCSTSKQRRAALKSMRLLPGFSWERCLVVMEDHSRQHASKIVAIGLGDARGRWHELLDILEHPTHLRIKAHPDEWRRVMGTTARLGRDAWKAQALFWASAVLGERITDDNEAEGCVLATWGAFDGLQVWAAKRAAGLATQRKRRQA